MFIYSIDFNVITSSYEDYLLCQYLFLTFNVPIATKVVYFFRLLKGLLEASLANSVDPDQTAPIGAV